MEEVENKNEISLDEVTLPNDTDAIESEDIPESNGVLSKEASASKETMDDVDIGSSETNGEEAPENDEGSFEEQVLDTEEETIATEDETEIDSENNTQATTPEKVEQSGKITKLEDEMEVNTVVETEVESPEDDDDYDDDQQFRHEVKVAIECYCLVMKHPLASAKMIEISLECIGLLISNRYVVGSTLSTHKVETKDEEDGFNKESDVTDLINKICECADSKSDAVQNAMVKGLLSLMTSPACAVHEAGMLKAFRTVFHVYLISTHEEVKQVSREVLLDMLRSVFQRMEAYDAIMSIDEDGVGLPGNPNKNSDDQAANSLFASRYHTDSYLLFRALCKLSAKLLPEDTDDASSTTSSKSVFSTTKVNSSDPMATSTKILSLELIKSVFEHCGSAFRDGEKFIYAVQNFLCVSLLKNCMSSNTVVAHKSLQVFLLLVSLHLVQIHFIGTSSAHQANMTSVSRFTSSRII